MTELQDRLRYCVINDAGGFILAGPLVQAIKHRSGRALAYIIASSLSAFAFIAIICKPPFHVEIMSSSIVGFRVAVHLTMTNVFCAKFAKGAAILGFMHGNYGVGGTVVPLLATAMVSKGMQWSRFYLIP